MVGLFGGVIIFLGKLVFEVLGRKELMVFFIERWLELGEDFKR